MTGLLRVGNVYATHPGRDRMRPCVYSNPTACGNGTDLLANAVLRLAQQP